MTTTEAGFGTNVIETKDKDRALGDARCEISEKLGVAFGNPTMVTTSKAETIDSVETIEKWTANVAKLTKNSEEMVKEVKRLQKGGPNNNISSTQPNKKNIVEVDADGFKQNGYCWMYRYTVEQGHHCRN